MTSKVFTAKALITFIGAALFLRLYKLSEISPFDHDQTVPAQAAWEFFKLGKLTLIGQELSFQGFFLGPLHTWIQFIPYGLCNLLPDCVPYFYLAIGLLSLILLNLVVRQIFGGKIATLATFVHAVSFWQISQEIGVNSNYFIFPSAILLLHSMHKYLQGQDKYLPLGMFISGIATVNFNPVFIFSAAAFFLCAIARNGRSMKIIAISVFLFLANYLPLLIFNLRHDNILSSSLANFLAQNAPQQNLLEKLSIVLGQIALPFYSGFLFHFKSPYLTFLTTVLLLAGIILAAKSKDRLRQFLVIWITASILGFTLYSGHIPDYYFMQTLLPFVLLIAPIIQKNFIVLLAFFILLVATNAKVLADYRSSLNYQIKKEVVSYVLADSRNQPFNLYYQMPPGLNTGYGYLFKAMGKEPQENAKNLYILDFANPQEFDRIKYLKTFKDKEINFEAIGFVNIVSVKLD